MPNVGPLELMIIVIIALVVVGPKQLPHVARSIGSSLRELKSPITDQSAEYERSAERRSNS
jgi:sec-independent protein translocase protein TatA